MRRKTLIEPCGGILVLAVLYIAVRLTTPEGIREMRRQERPSFSIKTRIKNIFILLLFLSMPGMSMIIADSFRKPVITRHSVFEHMFLGSLKGALQSYVNDEKAGIDTYGMNAVITDKEEFMSGLEREVVYKKDMRKYFNAGIFKILVHNNLGFIQLDLDRAVHYISRSPLRLKENIIKNRINLSRRYYLENQVDIKSLYSEKGWPVGGRWLFFGNPDIKSDDINAPVGFTEEMNILYVLFCVFANDPPVSTGTFP